MDIQDIKEILYKSNLYNWKMVQVDLNRVVLFKVKYKYTDCLYISANKENITIRYERVFDNKYLDFPVERLFINKVNFCEKVDLINYINKIVEF